MLFFINSARISVGEFETFLTQLTPVSKKTKLQENPMKRKSNASLYLTRGAMIAAMYVALTYLSTLAGLSSGVIQFRISEALCILPIFFPEAILGLTIGCAISNLIAGGVIWDIVFGSIATLIGAIGARLMRKLPERLIFLATLPTVLANAIIVPFVLIFAYGAEGAYPFFFLTVGFGELVCAGIFGTALYYGLRRLKFK